MLYHAKVTNILMIVNCVLILKYHEMNNDISRDFKTTTHRFLIDLSCGIHDSDFHTIFPFLGEKFY
jgi:hypothetical protein